MEELHKLGKVYNSLSLSNIVTINARTAFDGKGATEPAEGACSIMLTNFSSCSHYLDAKGNHILPHTASTFKGNIAFSSVYTMGFQSPSRRDDLISLAYMLIYLVQGRLSILGNFENLSESDSFKCVFKAKQ